MPDDKKEKKTILTAIKEKVLERPKSIYELSKELGSNWDTIKNNVLLLQDLGIVKLEDQKVIYIQDLFIQRNTETMAGFPVSKETKRKVYALAKKIILVWENKTDKPMNNTILQKSLVEIADEFPQLQIPRGWYLFGKVVLVKVDRSLLKSEDYRYDFSKIIDDVSKLEKKIFDIVERFSQMTTDEIVDEQYNNYNRKDYQLKKEIKEHLMSDNLKENKEVLAKLLYDFVFSFDYRRDNELSEEVFLLLKDTVTIILERLFNKEIDYEILRCKLIEIFTSLWRLVGIYNLYTTKEGDIGYDNAVAKSFFEDKLNRQMIDFMDLFQELGFVVN